jgi:chaperonin cofactor prefoldin
VSSAAKDEQEAMRNQLNMIIMQKQNLLNKLKQVENALDARDAVSTQQDTQLADKRQTVSGWL